MKFVRRPKRRRLTLQEKIDKEADRLKPNQVAMIREAFREGYMVWEIAGHYKILNETAQAVLDGKKCNNLP